MEMGKELYWLEKKNWKTTETLQKHLNLEKEYKNRYHGNASVN